ncbi:MAG: PDZ domain-containing protein [Bacteroidales bacterium]
MMFKKQILLITGLFILSLATGNETRLLRQPAVSENHIAFAYGSNIWITGLNGGEAKRLTSFRGIESNPKFSPDGRWIAFSGQFAGSTDVYVIPVEGGEMKRLTWHPGADIVRGWTPDGKVVFTSGRESAPVGYPKFFSVGFDDGLPEALPIPRGYRGEYSPDGKRFAYELVRPSDEEWRNYRGGQNRPVWVLNMEDHSLYELPQEDNARNQHPVWIGNTVYFLSDRDYTMNLYSYDMASSTLKQLTFYSEYDIKYLSSGGGLLVYEYGGDIYKYNPSIERSEKLTVSVRGDFPWAMPGWKNTGNSATNGSLSPGGVRAVFEARGDIFTVPVEKGDWRNLTGSPGTREIYPIWSPSGEKIAWFSDESGEYRLMTGTQDGLDEPREIELPEPNFIYTPAWSPDSKYILYTDADLKLWLVEIESGNVKMIDQDRFIHPQRTMDPVWSPDSKWIAYAKRLTNQFHAIKAYSLDNNEILQLTDGMSDAVSPAWDASGKYLYFLASTDFGLNTGWLDMSSYEKPVTRAIYLIVLNSDDPSPLLPESDEESADDENEENNDKEKEVTVKIDPDGIDQRILSVDVPSKNYSNLSTAGEGMIFYMESVTGQPGPVLHLYELDKREAESYLSPVQYYSVSADGRKLLYRSGRQWGIVETKGKPSVGDGQIDVSSLQARHNPEQEWEQIFEEAWRVYRDYLYVDNYHGADWQEVYNRYKPFVEHIKHRDDLNYLLGIMGGEVSMGHSYVFGGDMPDIQSNPAGLPGADLAVDNGRYRIKKIFTGENWNPDLRSPLSAPGVRVAEGDYIIAVDGSNLEVPVNPYSLFENKANKQVVLRVNNKPEYEGSWLITIVPVSSEAGLRRLDWVEENIRKVDKMSDGRLAYVWLPNTGQGGYSYFNRYYFAQQHKKGAVIDERFNGGGSAADYMVDIMSRDLHGFFNNRINPELPFTSPGAGIWGPKVMIINEHAGSGGDLLPYMFKFMEIGPVVGTTTWGGLVGIWDYPRLIDGGAMVSPRGGFYDTDGEWAVENEGVAPDIEVEMIPELVIKGQDPQLERAVEEALKLLEENPVKILPEPEAPVRYKRAPERQE